jgi:hypothetical protein
VVTTEKGKGLFLCKGDLKQKLEKMVISQPSTDLSTFTRLSTKPHSGSKLFDFGIRLNQENTIHSPLVKMPCEQPCLASDDRQRGVAYEEGVWHGPKKPCSRFVSFLTNVGPQYAPSRMGLWQGVAIRLSHEIELLSLSRNRVRI